MKDKRVNITIYNVLYILSINLNLLLVAILINKEFIVLIKFKSINIYYNKTFILKIIKERKLAYLKINIL